MPQYYENNPALNKEHKHFKFLYNGRDFLFTTHDGVFSKDGVDPYSLLLLECVSGYHPSGDVLDLGCGYGAIGIILSACFEKVNLFQSEINQAAVELTRLNARQNRVASRVICSDGYENIHYNFDFVVLNPPIHAGKATVYTLFRQTKAHLNNGGQFFMVMHKKHGAQRAIDELKNIFATVQIIYKKKGVHVVRCLNEME